MKRLIEMLGRSCAVMAPSLTLSPGNRMKTIRRGAERLARLLWADELTESWPPDLAHGATRDLVRLRDPAVRDRI